MNRQLTVSLTKDELKEAVRNWIIDTTGDTVDSIEIEADAFKTITCTVRCVPPKTPMDVAEVANE